MESTSAGIGEMGKGRIAALAVALLATLLLLVSVDTRSAFAQELSLDDTTIQSFKIIDTTHGDAEIEYSLSSEASPKTDPAAFSNAICQNQTKSALRLEAKVAYDGSDAIQDGDTLAIPAKIGHSQDFASRPLVDGDGNQLGTFEYTDGKYLLKFSGDYIKDHSIKKFDAMLQTGALWNASDVLGRTTELGERALVKGTLGKDVLYAAYEKQYIVAQSIGTTKGLFGKASATSTNGTIEWGLEIYNDCQQINGRFFNNPYMLENDGAYSPNSYTGVYLEDTFADCTGAPEITVTWIPLGGINDQGKVFSWWYNANPPLNVLLTKVDQGTRSKSDVKDALQNGQYCMYDNQDGSYTFMLKWWDMNDPAGPKYDDIPEIAAAGGVGDYLKENFSDIFGGMSPATIEKINQIYAGKALQSLKVKIAVSYQVVNAPTSKTNTAILTTDQGSFTSTATGSMTPSGAAIDAPADPLALKMLKTDKESGAALSAGFSFKLQSSDNGGASWTDVAVGASMLDAGILNADGTLTPDVNGAIQVKGLTGGMMYRFVEVSHANGYPDVTVDEAHPNDVDHPTSANSEAVTVASQGAGQVIIMYNQKAKVDVSGVKIWDDDNDRDGVRPASITVNLLRDGTPIDSKTVTPDASGTWAYSFSGLAQYDSTDGHEFDYSITEDPVAGYTATVAGFDITNTHVPGTVDVTVSKIWNDGNDKDGIRPASVMAQLYADGVAQGGAVELSSANGWTSTWTGLAEYQGGHKVSYTVEEASVPDGYTSSVKEQASGNFVITNAHTPKVNPTPEPGPAPDPSSPGSKPPASGHQGKSMPATGEGPVLPGILTLAAASLVGLAWAAKKRMRNEGGMQS